MELSSSAADICIRLVTGPEFASGLTALEWEGIAWEPCGVVDGFVAGLIGMDGVPGVVIGALDEVMPLKSSCNVWPNARVDDVIPR